jgi:hypothetical protein
MLSLARKELSLAGPHVVDQHDANLKLARYFKQTHKHRANDSLAFAIPNF